MRLPPLLLLVVMVLPHQLAQAVYAPATGAEATSAGAASPAEGATAANAVIEAQSEAAVAAGQPAKWLVTFRVSEQQVAAQAQAVQQAAGLDAETTAASAHAAAVARRQVYAAVKSRVLGGGGAAASPTASVVTESSSGAAQAQSQLPLAPVQVLADYSHLPITFVSISSAVELARLRSNPEVLSVKPNGVARTMGMQGGLAMIGQPAAAERGFVGGGSVAIIDTGTRRLLACGCT